MLIAQRLIQTVICEHVRSCEQKCEIVWLALSISALIWSSYMGSVITEHRLHGTASISLASFILLAEATPTTLP
jgi:hypothetical protein